MTSFLNYSFRQYILIFMDSHTIRYELIWLFIKRTGTISGRKSKSSM